MSSKRKRMLLLYRLPIFLMVLRISVTIIYFVFNPLGLPLRFVQIAVLLFYLIYLFFYLKLFSDGVPVISIMTPTIIHGIVVFIFRRSIPIIPFAVLITIDILFLAAKSVKANLYPFDVDGDEEEKLFDDSEFEGAVEPL